ncbi:MAG: amidohydrolase family protein [Pirellulales bacterium]
MSRLEQFITRRQFVGRSFAIGVSMAVHRCPKRAKAAVVDPNSHGYFDIHVHLAQRWYGEKHGPLTATQMLRWMDAHNVSQAVVLPLVSPEAFWYPVTTEYVLRETAPHRDRLIPFCAIDPRALSTHLTETQQVVDMLNRYREAGARGFGEHKPQLPIDDPLNLRLYDACNEVKLPVLFHLDNKANMDEPGLPGLAKALRAFPELPFIGHGKGWWASISGGLTQADLHVGYPKGPVQPYGAIDKLMDQFPNLYGDLSSSGAHAVLRDQDFGEKFLIRRADRLLFGTDYYDLAQRNFQQFDLFQEFQLPDNIRRKISLENARMLLALN